MNMGAGMRTARALTWATMAIGAACIVSSIVWISSMGVTYGIAPGAGDIFTYLYEINALTCLFMILFGVSITLRGKPRTVFTKVSLWGLLLLCTMAIKPFVTDSLPYLGSVGFVAAFRLVCVYLPHMCLIASISVLLTTWDSATHGALRDTNFIASLLSVFASVVYLWNVFPLLGQATTAYDTSQVLGIVFATLALPCQCIAIWAICSSDQLMARVFMRYDSEWASAYVEAKKAQQARLGQIVEEAVADERLRTDALAVATAAKGADDEQLDPGQVVELARAAREELGRQPADDELEEERNTRDQERQAMYQGRLNIYQGGSDNPDFSTAQGQPTPADEQPDDTQSQPARPRRRIPAPGQDDQE